MVRVCRQRSAGRLGRGVEFLAHRRGRRGRAGAEQQRGVGAGHRAFRLLDRAGACGHTDFRRAAADAPVLEKPDRPRGGTDDPVRGGVRRRVPRGPRGARLDGLDGRTPAGGERHLAGHGLPPDVGRDGRQHVLPAFPDLLVHWPDSGLRPAARLLHGALETPLRAAGAGLAGNRAAVEGL